MKKVMHWPADKGLIAEFCNQLEEAREAGIDVEVEMPEEARLIHGKAVYLNEMLQAYGYEQRCNMFFNTLLVRPADGICTLEELRQLAIDYELDLPVEDDAIKVEITEQTDLDDMNALIAFFAEGAGGMAPEVEDESEFEGLSIIED